MLGKGLSLDEILDQMGMVVEGVRTTKAAHQLAENNNFLCLLRMHYMAYYLKGNTLF